MVRKNNKLIWVVTVLLLINLAGLIYTQLKLRQNESQRMQKIIYNQKLFLATTTDRIDHKIGALSEKLNNYADALSNGSLNLEGLNWQINHDREWLNYGIYPNGLKNHDFPKLNC